MQKLDSLTLLIYVNDYIKSLNLINFLRKPINSIDFLIGSPKFSHGKFSHIGAIRGAKSLLRGTSCQQLYHKSFTPTGIKIHPRVSKTVVVIN